MREDLVIATTTNKLINKAKLDGNLNLSVVSYLNVLSKTLEFLATQPMTQTTVDKILKVRNDFVTTMNSCSNVCNYRISVKALDLAESQLSIYENHAPTIADNSKTYGGSEEAFTYSAFTAEFNDLDQGDVPKLVRITSLPDVGEIRYSTSAINPGFEFELANVGNLTYTDLGNSTGALSTSFSFRTSDDNAKPLFSNEAQYTINFTSTANDPATIGDISITVQHGVTTVLTMQMFTDQSTPPYNDPEGDLIDAVRVDRLYSTNKGQFQLNGVPVQNGDIITREQINNNEFTHVGDTEQTINTDGFDFSIRDEGSGIWVQ